MAAKKGDNSGRLAAEELKLLVERAERIKEEIKAMQDDLKDVFGEAKSRGYDVPTIKTVIKLRKMEPQTRRSTLSMLEIYMTALGLSDGSLSDMARDYIEEARHGSGGDEHDDTADGQDGAEEEEAESDAAGQPTQADPGAPPPPPPPPPLTVVDARRLGAAAATGGRPVTSNPFPAGDARRAAWDEAWCQALGTDGMDIPPELRAPPKPPKGEGEPK